MQSVFYTLFLAQHNHSGNISQSTCAILSFCVPCPFSTWVIIGLHNFLTFLDILFFIFVVSPNVCFTIYLSNLVRQATCWFHLFHSAFSMSRESLQIVFLNMCPRHFLCLFLKLIISFTVVCISLSAMLYELNVVIFFVRFNIYLLKLTSFATGPFREKGEIGSFILWQFSNWEH